MKARIENNIFFCDLVVVKPERVNYKSKGVFYLPAGYPHHELMSSGFVRRGTRSSYGLPNYTEPWQTGEDAEKILVERIEN